MNRGDRAQVDAAEVILETGWSEISPLLDRLLDSDRANRAETLEEICRGDKQLQGRLEDMLAECEKEIPFFRGPALDRFDQLADDVEGTLPDVLAGRYETGRLIARGGMARVYLARDIKHNRDVALKVVRPELAASIGRDLFLREIAIAARLRHPNIVPVYDSGDDAGIFFFVMPYETGRSLRDKIREGPIATPDVVRILRDVACALDYAHDQGIVHRDVKPDNVMISGGSAVVTDFGISVAMRAARESNSEHASELGDVRGTPAYMSPEQAAGDPATNYRTDIYAFGCMAYELLSGRPPFAGLTAADLAAAHTSAIPQRVSTLRKDIPEALSSLIDRCLEKDPAARPQSASAIVHALDNAAASIRVPPKYRPEWLIGAGLIAVSLAVMAAYSLFSQKPVPSSADGRIPIAVLPLKNADRDSSTAVLADGFSDEIATALVSMPWLRVMSRGGSTGYRRSDIDYRQTGRDLGAKFIVTGSMRQSAGHVVVAIQLIDAEDGSTRWAADFDRQAGELAAERDEIARLTAASLRPLAGNRYAVAPPAPAPHRAPNGDAYFLQVQAQQWLDRRGQSVKQSAEYFRRATVIDPGYAKAYSGLSMSLALYPYFQNTPAWAVRDEVMSNARKALELDPTLAQPHVALALALQHNNEWRGAAAQFDSAVRLDPHDVEARVQYGRHLLFRGRTADALAQFQAARTDDPASSLVLGWVAYTYFIAKKQDSARVISERAVQSNSLSLSSVTNGAEMRLFLGDIKEARRLISMAPANFPVSSFVRAATGVSRTSVAGPSKADSSGRSWMSNTTRAYILLWQRDTTRAVNALEDATEAREIWTSVLPSTDPLFDPVRGDPRFQAILKRVGLSP